MCYSGKCRYETWDGECKVGHHFPEDALCVRTEREIEEYEKEVFYEKQRH